MIVVPSANDRPTCLIQSYSPAWQLGTGLAISLAPGTYPITGENQLQGVVYFRLGDRCVPAISTPISKPN